MNCVMPSCREGCTADLYICTFIFVIYYEYSGLNISIVQDEDGVESISWDEDELPALDEFTMDLNNTDDNATNIYYSMINLIKEKKHDTATFFCYSVILFPISLFRCNAHD